ncbi:MAG TPA: hypothetical protein PLB41_15285 [Rubrivivax sp.]|nr:hypothetical protein [Rubrivivax sp.]
MEDLLLFVAGCAIGGLLSWLITHRYYIKAGKDQQAELSRLSSELRPRNSLRDFEDLLTDSAWTKEVVDHTEIWIASKDARFQIVHGDQYREFKERWTSVYPDQNSSAYPVYLKIGETIVKELTFISMDGGRIFVPMPEVRPLKGANPEYFWNVNSLAVKVCRINGAYYIYNDLEGVARTSKVVIVE